MYILSYPGVAGRGGRPHCHHDQTCMMVIVKGAALRRIDISLLETGRHPKTALIMSLFTRVREKNEGF